MNQQNVIVDGATAQRFAIRTKPMLGEQATLTMVIRKLHRPGDLKNLYGHSKWDNPLNIAYEAKTAGEVSRHQVPDHFAGGGKMVCLDAGSQCEVEDILLTRLMSGQVEFKTETA